MEAPVIAPVAVVAAGEASADLEQDFRGRGRVDAVRVGGVAGAVDSSRCDVLGVAVAAAGAGGGVVGLVAVG